jgi:2-dehydropantoate 2-reductase
MRIVVMGAGAVGAYFGGKLALAGEDVVFVARGANLAALRSAGLRIVEVGTGESRAPKVFHAQPVQAVDDPRAAGRADLVLVAVKSYDTEAAGAALRPVVTPDTIVLSLQNGIENEAVLATALGMPPLLAGLTHIGAELAGPGVVRRDSGGRVIFGELDGRVSDRAQRVADVFARAGVAHHLSRHIAIMLWDKLSWNAAFNACTAVARRTVGELLAHPDGRVLVRAAMLEVVAVANASGVRLDAARVDPEIERSAVELGSLKTSMQQDRERGRRLEHEALNGAVVRAADRTGVRVPVNRVLYGLLSVLDRQARSAPSRPS